MATKKELLKGLEEFLEESGITFFEWNEKKEVMVASNEIKKSLLKNNSMLIVLSNLFLKYQNKVGCLPFFFDNDGSIDVLF